MFFNRKQKKDDKQIEEIKKTMDAPKPSPSQPQHEEFVKHEPASAPLFVKVDKYQNVLTTINEMRSFVSSMKQLFNVMYELETIRNDSLKMMRAGIQRLEKSIVEMDSELLRPKGIDMQIPQTASEVHHIEDSLSELQKQLSDLRKELHELGSSS